LNTGKGLFLFSRPITLIIKENPSFAKRENILYEETVIMIWLIYTLPKKKRKIKKIFK
jgi:hypothetical protein